MTGYLHRLALSVLRPGGAIHPVVPPVFGSPVFSSPAPDPLADTPSMLEESAESRAGESPRAAADSAPAAPPARLPASRPPPRAQPFFATATDQGHEPVARDSPSPESALLPASSSVPAVFAPLPSDPVALAPDRPSPRAAPNRAAPDRAAPDRRNTEGAEADSLTGGAEGAGPGPAPDTPTRPAALSEPARFILSNAHKPIDRPVAKPSVAPRRPAEKIFSADTTAGRTSQDVEIHIGRIEVTALPPPPPAATRPRRTAPTLEDYLRRRDGRA